MVFRDTKTIFLHLSPDHFFRRVLRLACPTSLQTIPWDASRQFLSTCLRGASFDQLATPLPAARLQTACPDQSPDRLPKSFLSSLQTTLLPACARAFKSIRKKSSEKYQKKCQKWTCQISTPSHEFCNFPSNFPTNFPTNFPSNFPTKFQTNFQTDFRTIFASLCGPTFGSIFIPISRLTFG